MEMKKTTPLHYAILLFVPVFLLVSGICTAQEAARAGRSEFFGLVQYMTGDDVSESGLSLEVDDFTGFGLGYGYNINDNVNLNFDVYFGNTDIDGSYLGLTATGDSDVIGFDLNVDWNFLRTAFTPLVTGGVGFLTFSGDINDDLPDFDSDFSETDFSFNAGAGFRWDTSVNFYIKGIYRATWTELEGTEDFITLDGPSISVGYVF